MKYSRFETLMISLGAVVIFGSLLLGPSVNQPGFWQEAVGQVLIIVVLGAAVHWGRDGGSVAAFAATLAYVITRIPLLSEQGLTKNIFAMIATRVLIYTIVGILGGEIFGRVKYIIAQLEGSSILDDLTQVYNRRYCGQTLKNGLGQFQRYQVPFSVAVISLAPGLVADLRPSRQRTLLRSTATHIRNDIRLVDDVGYLGDSRFLVILPQTSGSGAEVASDRIRRTVRDLFGAKDESVTATPLALPGDAAAICDLARSLDPETEEHLDDMCGSEESATA